MRRSVLAVWLSSAIAIGIAVYFTHDIRCLWFLLIPASISFRSKEPKTGHWRAVYQGDEIIDYRCSECEFGSTFGKSTYRMNYCPNCGCRMVEE